jgi:hypothetical protein
MARGGAASRGDAWPRTHRWLASALLSSRKRRHQSIETQNRTGIRQQQYQWRYLISAMLSLNNMLRATVSPYETGGEEKKKAKMIGAQCKPTAARAPRKGETQPSGEGDISSMSELRRRGRHNVRAA